MDTASRRLRSSHDNAPSQKHRNESQNQARELTDPDKPYRLDDRVLCGMSGCRRIPGQDNETVGDGGEDQAGQREGGGRARPRGAVIFAAYTEPHPFITK